MMYPNITRVFEYCLDLQYTQFCSHICWPITISFFKTPEHLWAYSLFNNSFPKPISASALLLLHCWVTRKTRKVRLECEDQPTRMWGQVWNTEIMSWEVHTDRGHGYYEFIQEKTELISKVLDPIKRNTSKAGVDYEKRCKLIMMKQAKGGQRSQLK